MTDARGEVRWSGQYCSFGEVRYQTARATKLVQRTVMPHQPFRYAGQYAEVKRLLYVLLLPFARSRATAISRAWGEERELVAAGEGSRDWTAAEREVILSTKNNRQLSSVMSEMGYTGHHINSVKGNGVLGGKWQGDPRNIVFLQNANHPSGYDEHLHGLQGHRGSYDTPGKGRLIDRNLTRKNLKSCQ